MNGPQEKRVRNMRIRIGLLSALVVCGAALVLRRAYELQVQQGPELRAMAEEQYAKEINTAPKRGTIYDRNGAELAVSVDVDSVYANPKRMHASGVNVAQAAEQLAGLLGLDRAVIEKRLASDRHFVWIKRRLTPKESKAVMGLDISGLALTSEARRYYPNRELLAHVLGFSNIDGQGIDGLELMLDTRLRGSTERVPAIRDRRGLVVFSEHLLDDREGQGDEVVLTIDKTIQHIAERELELAVRTFEAKAGSLVALDPQTGEILAMANFPTFNPNEPSKSTMGHRRNRAITDRFEPGSTLKPFTIAGALSGGAISAEQRIDCEDGAMRVAEYTIHDTHKWGLLTPSEILSHSSNIGIAKIGLALGRSKLYRALTNFGFGTSTDLGLPGETAGQLRNYKRWYEMDAATIAFGQGMSVTTLQLAVSMGALANRGRLMRPTIVKRVESARGEVLEEALPKIVRQVVSPYVAGLLSDMLTAVTAEEGTGAEAAVNGYLVAGKTGTAQKADYVHGGYAEDKWISSFVGFAPARRPRLLVAVIIDEPMIAHHGGTVAAPVFRRVVQASLRHMGVVPTVLQSEPVAKKSARKAQAAALPPPATPMDLAVQPLQALAKDEVRVPDLTGQHVRAALNATHDQGLMFVPEGSGVVRAQNPAPLSVVKRGTTVTAVLETPHPKSNSAPTAEGEKAKPGLQTAPTPGLVASAVVGGRDG